MWPGVLASAACVLAAEATGWVTPPVQAPRVQQRVIDSAAAGCPVSYHVWTPEQYDREPSRRFPVLYWLHGSGGGLAGVAPLSAWFGAAIQEGRIPPLLLVFPNGLADSMWCNSADGRVPMETVVMEELVPDVDRSFRTVTNRAGRLVEGFSMGGYGAARLACKYPDRFGAVSILAGGPLDLAFAGPRARARGRERERLLHDVYGDLAGYQAQSPWRLAEQHAAELRRHTLVRMATGALDDTLALNRAFSDHLTQLGLAHTFSAPRGVGHEPLALLQALGQDNWSFYRTALGEAPAAGD